MTALFPWYKAVYESGGAPEILWEDYQRDGYATETQKREMKLYVKALNKALDTPEGGRWRKSEKTLSQDWRKGSKAMPSYLLK